MKANYKYSVEIISEPEHLLEALQLRYVTYDKIYPKVTEHCANELESDEFDARSIHLGLYSDHQGQRSLSGYCRLVLPAFFKDRYSSYLVASPYLYQSGSYQNPRLSFFRYAPDLFLEKIDSFCRSLENENRPYAETSRFIIAEAHRSLSLSAFFTESMFGIASALKMKFNFFSCDLHHVAFYKKHGLTPFPELSSYPNAIFNRHDVIFGTNLETARDGCASVQLLSLQHPLSAGISFMKAA